MIQMHVNYQKCPYTEGVKCFDMPMSDEPNLGTWNIVAQLQVSCSQYVVRVSSAYDSLHFRDVK